MNLPTSIKQMPVITMDAGGEATIRIELTEDEYKDFVATAHKYWEWRDKLIRLRGEADA